MPNRVDAARLLIERGADVNAKDAMQDSPFLYAGAEGRLRDPAPDARRRRRPRRAPTATAARR